MAAPDRLAPHLAKVASAKDRKKLAKDLAAATSQFKFVPWPGPQTEAYLSQADELFYGGAAGGGKTAMLVGLAVQAHSKAIIFRREYSQIRGLEDEAAKLLGTRDGYNATEKVWRHGSKVLEFGSVPHEWDREKYQGRAHSFIGFDEITHFTPSIYRYLIGWNRSDNAKERCRVVVTGNPPTTAEGRWVVEYWAPWLDPNHPKPAKPGELRWFTTIKGEDVELEGPGPIEVDGRTVNPRSRTFIAAKLEDNRRSWRAVTRRCSRACPSLCAP